MDKKEKEAKKKRISSAIDLSGGRFKDDEINLLYDLVENPGKYDGQSKTSQHSYTGWCSDGKYEREEKTTSTIRSDDRGVRIEEHHEYRDDDGQSGSSDVVYRKGREILNNIGRIMRN